ncbi:MAG TPA: GspH/FimT family pseudopilin [Gemmatimonadales bacterium]|jgi:prepilin-type N-terminal cleavage/methylation domain-containing protein
MISPNAAARQATIGRTAPRGTAGFTLMDMIIVMVIMGILIAIAGPKFYHITSHVRVDEATTIVATDLRQAVSLAAREQKPVTVTTETSTRYIIKDRAASPADTVRLRRNLAVSAMSGVGSVSFSPASVVVYPNSTVSGALTVTLTTDSYTRTVTMSAAGQVRIQAP